MEGNMTELNDTDIAVIFGLVGVYFGWKRQRSLNNMLDEIREALPVI
jgi:hypothetical protein